MQDQLDAKEIAIQNGRGYNIRNKSMQPGLRYQSKK
jgi:hypothetical protein